MLLVNVSRNWMAALVVSGGLVGTAYAQVRVVVTPTKATAIIGESSQFSATVSGAADASVVWSVSAPQGSTLSAGTISATGLYQTPFPAPASVMVTATSKADNKASASVIVSLKAPALAEGPALSVDTLAVTHAISPLVYGMNDFSLNPSVQAQVHLPIDRWGGDHTTRYNYLLDVLNSGDDYFFENSNNGNKNAPDRSELNAQVERDKKLGSMTMVTMPLIGFVTRRVRACGFPVSLYPAQEKINPQDLLCGNGKLPDGKVITGNDPLLTSITSDERFDGGWVKYLAKRYGDAAHGGVKIYELDNEPEYWSSTHRDVHPAQMTYDEVTNKGLVYAKAIKQADPTALVGGPVISGWMNYFYSMADVHHGWETGPCFCFNGSPTDRLAHGNVPLLAYYLQHFKAAEARGGGRLLDILDLHAYYAAKGAQFAPAGDTALQAARLNSTRAFWDPTYLDPEITDPDAAVRKEKAPPFAIQMIPLMKRLVAENYPGTKLAITEYNWGGMESMNGALAQAEILALFGREGLDVGTLWGPPDAVKEVPGVMAFKVFEDYDGMGSTFGDGSLRATSADQGKLAIYAAERSSDHMLTVLVLNKSFGDLTGSVALTTTAKVAQVYRYSNGDLNEIRKLADAKVTKSGIAATFPAQSLTLFVLAR
jgi:hypothetical protein